MKYFCSLGIVLFLSGCLLAPQFPQAEISADGKTLTFKYMWLKSKLVAEVPGPDIVIVPQRLRPYMLDTDWHYYRAQYCVPYDNQCGIAISQLNKDRFAVFVMGGPSNTWPKIENHDVGAIDYEIINVYESLF